MSIHVIAYKYSDDDIYKLSYHFELSSYDVQEIIKTEVTDETLNECICEIISKNWDLWDVSEQSQSITYFLHASRTLLMKDNCCYSVWCMDTDEEQFVAAKAISDTDYCDLLYEWGKEEATEVCARYF